MHRARALASLALLAAASAGAQPTPLPEHPRVQQALKLAATWLEAERAYMQIPAVSAAIVSDQQLLWSGGFGYADVARKAPATGSTIYSICSISKLFTSTALMQLRDAGKVRLDDPVAKHLSWFAIKRTDPQAAEITVEGLLTHASGLPRESDWPYWSAPDFVFPTREQVIEKIASQETLYPAETYFQYSNLGLTLAGEIVAAASGEPYAQYVQKRILGPLHLASTTSEMPERERGGRLAVGYTALGREGVRRAIPFFQARGIAPAAGYASTPEDLARFAMWQFRTLATSDTTVLRANTLREMQRVHFMDPGWQTSWGLGYSVWRADNKTFVGHGGSCPGYQTQLLLRPEEKLAMVAMTNTIDAPASMLAQRLYDIVAPAVLAARKDSTTKPKAPDATLAAYEGTYESSFGGERAVFVWEDGLATIGLPTDNPLRAIAKYRKVGEHTFRRIRDDGALGEAITFKLGPDGKATEVWQNSNRSPRIRPPVATASR